MTLIKLLQSDLERYYFYTGRPDRMPKVIELYKCFIIPRCLLATLYRLSHSLYKREWLILGQLITWIAFFLFGSEINSRTKIGPGLFFPHPNGIVIGAISIGCNAVIYHQTTIGAERVESGMDNRPVLGNNIVIGAGAKILGDFTLPDNSLVKANSLVTKYNYNDLAKTNTLIDS
jgi:serine O-acetyltransferase